MEDHFATKLEGSEFGQSIDNDDNPKHWHHDHPSSHEGDIPLECAHTIPSPIIMISPTSTIESIHTSFFGYLVL